MGGMYCFQPAKEGDLEVVLALVRGAGAGEEKAALCREALDARELYVLRDGDQVTGMAVLGASDARWDDGEEAMYLRAMEADAADIEARVYMLSFCDVIARSKKKKYLRLACAAQDEQENVYYTRQGFVSAGEDAAGDYRLYQKDLTHCCCCHEEKAEEANQAK